MFNFEGGNGWSGNPILGQTSVNLRENAFINSTILKWLYADLLVTPEEIVLYRQVKNGGLGFVSVKYKSLAFQIKTFIILIKSYLILLHLSFKRFNDCNRNQHLVLVLGCSFSLGKVNQVFQKCSIF